MLNRHCQSSSSLATIFHSLINLLHPSNSPPPPTPVHVAHHSAAKVRAPFPKEDDSEVEIDDAGNEGDESDAGSVDNAPVYVFFDHLLIDGRNLICVLVSLQHASVRHAG